MTIKSMELRYSLSTKDREDMFRLLAKRSLAKQGSGTRFFSSPYVQVAACVGMTYMIVQYAMQMIPVVSAYGWTILLSSDYIVDNLLSLLFAYLIIQYARQFFAEYRQRSQRIRTGKKGVKSGEHHLRATPKGLSVNLAKRSTIYKWAAFLDLIETKDMLLLTVTPRQAVAIPKDAFRSKTEEESFREYIHSHMTAS